MRANIHTGLNSSPGALVFGRDMFLNVPLTADWLIIQKHRQQLIDENLRRQNKRRHDFDYVQGGKILKKVIDPTKLGYRHTGPYLIQQVHSNGTLTIKLRESVYERINIRRVKPYNEPT